MIYPKNGPNQTCGYWLITPNYQTLWIENDIFNSGQLQISERQLHKNRQLQNNSVNGTNVDYIQPCQYACNLWSLNSYYGLYNEVAMQYTEFN